MEKKPTLSILICTIEGREPFLESLKYNIARQMFRFKMIDGADIEVVISKDKRGEHKIGMKRNALLHSCKGEWACFIDDDDQISDDYLVNALSILKTQNPDCINMIGWMTTNGMNGETFIHELKHKEYFTKDGIHYRPPNHLNIIRTAIGKQFTFPEINHGEDTAWAMDLCRSGLLKTEGRIEKIVYYYQYIPNK